MVSSIDPQTALPRADRGPAKRFEPALCRREMFQNAMDGSWHGEQTLERMLDRFEARP